MPLRCHRVSRILTVHAGQIAPRGRGRDPRPLTCAGAAGILGRMGDGSSSDDWTIDRYLDRMVEAGASDLFLRPETHVVCRIDGRIVRTTMPIPDAESRKEP